MSFRNYGSSTRKTKWKQVDELILIITWKTYNTLYDVVFDALVYPYYLTYTYTEYYFDIYINGGQVYSFTLDP